MIFKALYEQDKLFYEALEPLEIHEESTPQSDFDTDTVLEQLDEL